MYSDHTLPNLRMGQHLSSSFPAYLSKSRPEVMKSEFPPARLTSGRCGNFCELALCSTLCLLPQVLTAKCWRQGMLTLGLLAFLLEILSAACLPNWTSSGGLPMEPGTRCGCFQYHMVSKHFHIAGASKALEV